MVFLPQGMCWIHEAWSGPRHPPRSDAIVLAHDESLGECLPLCKPGWCAHLAVSDRGFRLLGFPEPGSLVDAARVGGAGHPAVHHGEGPAWLVPFSSFVLNMYLLALHIVHLWILGFFMSE